MMEETFGYVAPHAPALPLEFYDASDLDLAIKLERDTWFRQRVPPKMAVALTGDFKLRKRPHADPELFGRSSPSPTAATCSSSRAASTSRAARCC
jgi:hypothetical protein